MFRHLIFVSNGENGADIGLLRAGKYLDIETTGYVLSDSFTPENREKYNLKSCFGDKKARNLLNIEQSDMVIAFLLDRDDDSNQDTFNIINYARTGQYNELTLTKPEAFISVFDQESDQRPVVAFWDITQPKLSLAQQTLTAFLMKHQPQRIMVSGPSLEVYPEIEELVVSLFTTTLSDLFNPKKSLQGKTSDRDGRMVCDQRMNNYKMCFR